MCSWNAAYVVRLLMWYRAWTSLPKSWGYFKEKKDAVEILRSVNCKFSVRLNCALVFIIQVRPRQYINEKMHIYFV